MKKEYMCYIHYIIIFLLLVQLGISIYNLSYSSKKEAYQDPPIFTGYRNEDQSNNCLLHGDCPSTDCKEGDPGCFCVYNCSGTPYKFSYNCSAGLGPYPSQEQKDANCNLLPGPGNSTAVPL